MNAEDIKPGTIWRRALGTRRERVTVVVFEVRDGHVHFTGPTKPLGVGPFLAYWEPVQHPERHREEGAFRDSTTRDVEGAGPVNRDRVESPAPPRNPLPYDFPTWTPQRRIDWLMSQGMDYVTAHEADQDHRMTEQARQAAMLRGWLEEDDEEVGYHGQR